MFTFLVKVQILILFIVPVCFSYTPIVLWHGIIGTCCGNTITGKMEKDLKNYLPGVHVLNIQIGNSAAEDYWNSVFKHPDEQIEEACNLIRSDPLLAEGYNAVGISQGSQFLRGLAQRCPEPKMKNLVTMAGQHQGIYGIPHCNATSNILCDILRRKLSTYAYLEPIQEGLTPAAYWHDSLNPEAYIEGNSYMADINNEKNINEAYIKNLQSLERLIMVKYENDAVVQPLESEWFGFYKPGQSKKIETLQESEIYVSDRLGLKQMDLEGKLHFLKNTWQHPDYEWEWFKENIVDRYFI